MKQKDWAVIIVVAFISAILSFVISKNIFVAPKNRQQQVEVVSPIKPDFQQPNQRYFNEQSVNAAQLVQIGSNDNQTPFSGATQQ